MKVAPDVCVRPRNNLLNIKDDMGSALRFGSRFFKIRVVSRAKVQSNFRDDSDYDLVPDHYDKDNAAEVDSL